jgi:hypothetical protein
VERVEDLAPIPEYGVEHVPVVTLLVPGDTLGDQDIELLSYEQFGDFVNGCTRTRDKTEYALKSGKKLPIFYFRVLYKNPLSRIRPDVPDYETRMCFSYSPFVPGQPEVCGNEEYKRYT